MQIRMQFKFLAAAFAVTLGAGQLAHAVSIDQLHLVSEKGLSVEELRTLNITTPMSLHAGDYPDSLHAADYPNSLHAADYPDSLHAGDYPASYHAADYPGLRLFGDKAAKPPMPILDL